MRSEPVARQLLLGHSDVLSQPLKCGKLENHPPQRRHIGSGRGTKAKHVRGKLLACCEDERNPAAYYNQRTEANTSWHASHSSNPSKLLPKSRKSTSRSSKANPAMRRRHWRIARTCSTTSWASTPA